MHVTRLSLTNFRNFGRLELELPIGSTLLHGANAQGKTNLLESIYYLATTRSPQADQDQQLLNLDAVTPDEPIVVGRLVAQLESKQGRTNIELRLIRELNRGQPSFRRQAVVNGRKVRLMDLLGNLRVVLFLPHDLQIVTGSPAKRRRYLDITLCQTDSVYCRTLSSYNKVLEQRNALLRQIAEDGSGRDVLPIYNEKLAHLGSEIFAKRATFLDALARKAQNIHYEKLTDRKETLRLSYLPSLQVTGFSRGNHKVVREAAENGEWLTQRSDPGLIADRFLELLSEVEQSELASGATRIGPHRDDWRFWVNGRSLSSYGSRGQQRSAILAMKLAEIRWMAEVTGEEPLLLLDEVVAELDEHRRALLLDAVQDAHQAILTATDPGMFTKEFLDKSTTMTVTSGQVILDAREEVVGDE
jgi:DNA replication and repair protein RecF